MDLQLVFRDTTGDSPNYTLEYRLRNTRLAKSWYAMLVENFMQSTHPIEKTYCLKGWQNSWDSDYSRNLQFLCNELNRHIAVVNSDMPNKGYEYIDLDFTVDGLKDQQSQDILLNKIHHHFELLIGQVWNPSKWYELAEPNTRFSIRMLNNYCHEIESVLESIEDGVLPHLSVGINGIDSNGHHFCKKKRHEITGKEYKDFTPTAPAGSMTLYYSQLGKHHLEAFSDNDTDIHQENISGIRYVTGEFLVHFTPKDDFRKNKEYKAWLNRNGFDRKDRTLALDWGVVADLTKDADLDKLLKCDDLYKIQVYDQGNLIHERVYEDTWRDQHAWEQQIQ